MINVVIVDDHTLIRKGLAPLFPTSDFQILGDAGNGLELIELLKSIQPHVVLMDITMPEMDGIATTEWLSMHYPQIKVLALSMNSDDQSIIRMIQAGARGYMLKGATPEEMIYAVKSIHETGYYISDLFSEKMKLALSAAEAKPAKAHTELSDREKEFMIHCCTELTYKEIAVEMGVSARTVDGYRESVFQKLHLKSRIGVVLYAFKNEMIQKN